MSDSLFVGRLSIHCSREPGWWWLWSLVEQQFVHESTSSSQWPWDSCKHFLILPWDVFLFLCRKWESPLLHGLPVLPALHDLLDDVRLHLLWVKTPFSSVIVSSTVKSLCFSANIFTSPSLPSDWRIHCATSYAKDGFWLYLTQIASCSPWMFWMFLNSVFHFMWVAVLIMCQLYQVWIYTLYRYLQLFFWNVKCWLTSVCFDPSQIAALGITTNERMNARRYKHFKVTATSIESPFK